MFGSLGMPEILMILVIALIIFGPRKLPEMGKTLGKSLAQFRRASEDFKRQWEDEVTLERQRIDAPPPAPVEYSNYSAAASTNGEETAAASTDNDETKPSSSEDPALTPAVDDAQMATHHVDTAAQETKRDWM